VTEVAARAFGFVLMQGLASRSNWENI